MFEVPEAKRIRREDLRDSSPDSDGDIQNRAELEAKLRASFAGTFAFDDLDGHSAPSAAPFITKASKATKQKKTRDSDSDSQASGEDGSQNEDIPEEAEPEEFEFRLFTSAPTTKVALPEEDEGAPKGDGAMLRQRPESYYIQPPLTAEEKAEIAYAALSGEQVLERAKQRSWGMEMPWRVTHLGLAPKCLRSRAGTRAPEIPEEEKAKRKRPGKKRRVAARMRDREAKRKAEAADKSKMTKEEHLREKKKRLNRQRKLKRRAKSKGAAGQGEQADAGAGNSSDGSDDE